MKISKIDTIISPIQPNVCIVRVHTDEGLIGLGETFYGAPSVESYIHHQAAPILFEMTDVMPESASIALAPYVGYQGSGVETRGNSALDIALWDLIGKRAGLPLYEILGGAVQESVPIYNTCAGGSYINNASRQASSNWGISALTPRHDHEDLWAFLNQPARLARELVDAGIPGMKIWPFDIAAESSHGDQSADLRDGLRILEAIRNEVGTSIEIYLELHSLWTLRGASRLFREVAEFMPAWIEDPIRPDRAESLRRLAEATDLTIATGESLCGRRGFKPLLEAGALDVAIVDLGWSGGITEARKIASLADVYGVPVAPHDCSGPISLSAAVHWVSSSTNGLVQETSRAFYDGWYKQFVTDLPPIAHGRISPLAAPGLGVELNAALLASADTSIRTTTR